MTVSFPDLFLKSETHRFIGDLLTPVGVYRRLKELDGTSFLLESVHQNEHLGRYSIIALFPLIQFVGNGRSCDITIERDKQTVGGNPFDVLRALTNAMRFESAEEHTEPMWIGYFGYDMVRYIENIPNKNPDTLHIPESNLIIPSAVVTFDHISQTLTATFFSLKDAKTLAKNKEAVFDCLKKPSTHVLSPISKNGPSPFDGFTPNMTKETYESIVRKTKEYIYAGDIFQGVLSRRMETEYAGDSFETYRSLRRINPSPYLYHLRYENFTIVGSSPEMLVQLVDDKITIRPIAGTIRRGATDEEDRQLGEQLLSDEKERAEHMMLVDLARNDIGRVSVAGSVTAEKVMFVENYSHVKHLASIITGTLDPRYDAIDLFKAVFPAGTLSGTPKIRAMEIIDELESTRRGIYGGSIVSWRLNGSFNSCIIIRSALFKDNKAYIQVGAGLVADSVPAAEYDETLKKASAVASAIRQGKDA